MIDTTTYSISPDILAKEPTFSNYSCCICLNICYDPIILDCCEKLLCINCLDNMLKVQSNFPKCPYCNNKKFTFSLPDGFISRMFKGLHFKCPQCETKVEYDLFHVHLYNKCPKKTEGAHFCTNCHVIYNSDHDCNKYIDSLKDFSNKTQLAKKIAILKMKILGIELSKEIIEEEEEGMVYNKAIHLHKLKLTNERINPGYEQGWVCELCSDMIRNPQVKSYHCEQCTFDICEKCILYIRTRVPNTNLHNHELFLEMRDLLWECSICGEEYWKRQSWYCDTCDFDVCYKCYWKEK